MKRNIILSISLFVLFTTNIFSQSKIDFNFSADVVSRFIYRGTNVGGNSPHIQPSLAISSKSFEVGAFASYGLNNNYSELDLFCTYNFKGFSSTFINYNIPTINNLTGDFNRKTSLNIGEIAVKYEGTENIPSILLATNIYGDNKQYSTYIEMGWSILHQGNATVDMFIGITPFKGYYADKFGIVNLGVKFNRDIEITDNFSLPTYIVLSINPEQKTSHLVFGIIL